MPKPAKIVVYSALGGFQGGVERFLYQAAQALQEVGVECHGVFDAPGQHLEKFAQPFASVSFGSDALATCCNDADWLWLHKCPDCTAVSRLPYRPPLAVYVHDHDYYCFRRYKYFPFRRINCPLPSHLYCLPCGKASAHPGSWRQFQNNLKLIRQAELIIAGSAHMMHNLAINGFPAQKLRLLAPLIDIMASSASKETQAAKRLSPMKPEILFVGQVIRGKGADLLLEAVSQLTCDWHLTILGTGNDLERCQAIARRLGLADRVSFPGFVLDPTPFYQQATVLAFPSRWQEPFGLTGPEAMARGVPVVAFDVGGVRDWLRDGHNGIMVPAQNVRKMANALQTLLTNQELATKMGQQAKEDMAMYTKKRFARQLLDILAISKPTSR